MYESYRQNRKRKIQIFPVLRSISYSDVNKKRAALTATAVVGKKSIVIVAIVFIARLSSFSALLSFWLTMLKALAGVSSQSVKVRNTRLDRTRFIRFCTRLSMPETLNTRPSSKLALCKSNS